MEVALSELAAALARLERKQDAARVEPVAKFGHSGCGRFRDDDHAVPYICPGPEEAARNPEARVAATNAAQRGGPDDEAVV